jgi:hypothetical protein
MYGVILITFSHNSIGLLETVCQPQRVYCKSKHNLRSYVSYETINCCLSIIAEPKVSKIQCKKWKGLSSILYIIVAAVITCIRDAMGTAIVVVHHFNLQIVGACPLM